MRIYMSAYLICFCVFGMTLYPYWTSPGGYMFILLLRDLIEVFTATVMSKRMKKALAKKMEELEMTKKARLQIDRYKRQYKIMEGSRIAYNEELSIQLEKYRGQLDQLRLEKCNLDVEGNFTTSSSKVSNKKLYERIIFLLNQKAQLEEELKKSRSQLLNLSSQIVTHESSVDHMRLKRIDRQAKQEALKEMMSKVSYFESQLSMETVGLNKLMTKNRRMREEMESLLRERERFKRQLDELLSRLSAGKTFIHDLMEQGTVAFEHREEAQGKLLLLRRKRVVLQEKHGQAMRDLERELEDNIRSAVFMTKKGQERGGNAARAEEEESKRQLMQVEVRRLEKVLEKILNYFPDISDLNAMADQYLIQEDENFAIFNYVNEVNCEVENLQAAADQCKKNLIMEEERKKMEIKQQKLDLAVLQENLKKQKQLKEELIEKQRKLMNKRIEVIEEFTKMYKEMKSQPSPYELLIDKDDGGINAECSLKLLQKKVKEVLGKGSGLLSKFETNQKKVALIK